VNHNPSSSELKLGALSRLLMGTASLNGKIQSSSDSTDCKGVPIHVETGHLFVPLVRSKGDEPPQALVIFIINTGQDYIVIDPSLGKESECDIRISRDLHHFIGSFNKVALTVM
jgi:hypothetical protein